MAKKHSDTKQFFIGAAIMLVFWALGVFASGRVPFIFDYLYVSEGSTFLSKIYPFLLVAFSVAFAAFCKRKSKDAMFFGLYSLLIVPTALFLLLQICAQLNYEFSDYITFLFILFMALAVPVTSVFEGFFIAVYGNTRPVGFSGAHLAFCIIMTVAAVLPPIVYKSVKAK